MKRYQVMIFLAAFAARMTFVPHVVPIAAVEELQPLWALELTFLLRALENIVGFGAVVVLVALAAGASVRGEGRDHKARRVCRAYRSLSDGEFGARRPCVDRRN